MKKKVKNKSEKYLELIKTQYNIDMNSDNFIDIIKEEIKDSKQAFRDYFDRYIADNKRLIGLEWASAMYLFFKVEEQKCVKDITKYSNALAKYPNNFMVESILADINLRYYGDVFAAKDMFISALEMIPQDSFCHYSLGYIYHLIGIFGKSTTYYEKALEFAGDDSDCKARSYFNIAINLSLIHISEPTRQAE